MYRKRRGLVFILALHAVSASLGMQPPKSYYDALKDASIETIDKWLEQGWDIKQKDQRGFSVFSSVLNRHDMVTFLIEKGADIHERDHRGETLLHRTAWEGCSEVVEILIARGIQVNALSHDGTTPLLCACERTHAKEQNEERFKIVQKLLAHGADVNKRPNYGSSVLYKLAYSGLIKVAELLLAHGADVSHVHSCEGSMLRRALQEGNNDIAHLYIQYSFAHSNADLKKMREDLFCEFIRKYAKFFSEEGASSCALQMLKDDMKSLMNNTASKMRASYFLRDTIIELCLMREHCEDSVLRKDYLPLDMFELILQEARTISQTTEVPLRPSPKRMQEIIRFFDSDAEECRQNSSSFMQKLEGYKSKEQ
ncbi:MAG: ankyrin repeat domain-containing protein [Candidatus Babeliales bacterium]